MLIITDKTKFEEERERLSRIDCLSCMIDELVEMADESTKSIKKVSEKECWKIINRKKNYMIKKNPVLKTDLEEFIEFIKNEKLELKTLREIATHITRYYKSVL